MRRVAAIVLATVALAAAIPASAQAAPHLANGATRLVVVLLGRRRSSGGGGCAAQARHPIVRGLGGRVAAGSWTADRLLDANVVRAYRG
jgi:hypothetical protein